MISQLWRLSKIFLALQDTRNICWFVPGARRCSVNWQIDLLRHTDKAKCSAAWVGEVSYILNTRYCATAASFTHVRTRTPILFVHDDVRVLFAAPHKRHTSTCYTYGGKKHRPNAMNLSTQQNELGKAILNGAVNTKKQNKTKMPATSTCDKWNNVKSEETRLLSFFFYYWQGTVDNQFKRK